MFRRKLGISAAELDVLKDRCHRVVVMDRNADRTCGCGSGHNRWSHPSPMLRPSAGSRPCDRRGPGESLLALRPTVAAGTCGPATRNPVASPCAHRVTSDLFANKLIVGLVFVERADDVVAIHPSVLAIQIAFAAVGFSPADHVEPVLRPSLAKVRRRQAIRRSASA